MPAKLYSASTATAPLKGAPSDEPVISSDDSELLFGESFEVERDEDGWFYGRSCVDGYQGYVRQEHLLLPETDPTHFCDHRLSHIYPAPNFKSSPLMPLPFMGRLHLSGEEEGGFVKLAEHDGWVFQSHIAPLPELSPSVDFVNTALAFIGCPYVYGGRSALGIDCSGLVQIALLRSGISCPRDSKDQARLGQSIDPDHIQRGDLVFFTAHVGIMVDEDTVLNATSRTMDVRLEKLDDMIEIYDGLKDIRRL